MCLVMHRTTGITSPPENAKMCLSLAQMLEVFGKVVLTLL